MPFDTSTRNRLAGFVKDARDLITAEFTQQFSELYGIAADGTLTPVAQLTHLDENGRATAALLRERIAYLVRAHPEERGGPAVAVTRLAREQAFTVLNRLAAVRMAEKRGLILPSVGKGYQSDGFRIYDTVAGKGLGDVYRRYRRYLFCLFDELAIELGVLFNRHAPQGLLFPREKALLALLDLLNAQDLEGLWAEDETIGWIYQYYNDPLERKKMREQSAAPRNSRELAVRNQFFTPRYVVEFLTDNTLGRIWYEMSGSATSLKEKCRYLVRRPNEIFLKPGESAPEQPKQDGLSQEELLKLPVHIPHRPLKDPRMILMLDPACGSMHFGLYAFDLFEIIYHEAWELEEKLGAAIFTRPAGMKSLHETFATKEDFLRQVPRLIIEHNIHGIDIDPRAAQIAGLSLWLRAQRAWKDMGLNPAERPTIKRSNIVCAEPMPGDKELLRQFVDNEFPAAERAVFLRLLEIIFDKMQLAGEAGSLLKIEEEIRSAIAEAKQLWKAGPMVKQSNLFPEAGKIEQKEIKLDMSGITDEQFWERVEQDIYAALEKYAAQAESAGGFQRRLFAEDAARGFAFIDVCRKRYDVIEMNPPFGAEPKGMTELIRRNYSDGKSDLYACFVERAASLGNENLRIGVLSSRTGFFLTSLENWRGNYLLGKHHLQATADLGLGVLDDALVEAAAYVVSATPATDACFISCLANSDKDEKLLNSIARKDFFVRSLDSFQGLPLKPIAYWVSSGMTKLYSDFPQLEGNYGYARVGVQTSDDFRFLKGFWEVPIDQLAVGKTWAPMAKGGEYQLFYDDVHLVVNWSDSAKEMKAFALGHAEKTGSARGNSPLRDFEFYFCGGITYPERTTSEFGPRVLPDGCITGTVGPGVHIKGTEHRYFILGWLTTRFVRELIEVSIGLGDAVESGSAARHYNIKTIGRLPVPTMDMSLQKRVAEQVHEIVVRHLRAWSFDESSRVFVNVGHLADINLKSMAESAYTAQEESILLNLNSHFAYEKLFASALSKAEGITGDVDRDIGIHPCALEQKCLLSEDELISGYQIDEESLVNKVAERVGYSRQVTKKAFFADRRLELLALWAKCHPGKIAAIRRGKKAFPPERIIDQALNVVSYFVGCAFARWDIRYATGEKAAPELPDPFAPLPVCPPGQLQNAQAFPANREEVPAAYPLKNIPWDGILVDDEGHERDIVSRVGKVIELIWKDRAEAIEQEACEILGVNTLRDYFRKPAGFFADHLSRYSKSRRQAPIYWPLSTKFGSYTLWIYYHRLNDQTLHTAVADFVDPKIRATTKALEAARANNRGGEASDLADLLDELNEFRAELERLIKLPWKPNLNDGVLITASPLWKLFRFNKWQSALKPCWEELEAGDYDWAHLAYTIWPDRVREKCKSDRSLAIAHGLEKLCETKAPEKKAKKGKKKKEAELELEEEAP